MAYDLAKLPDQALLDVIVQDVIGPGLTLFVGMPHSYKSYTALDLTYSVATGGYFLETFRCRRGHVLYVALEDGVSRINKRIEDMELQFPSGSVTLLEDEDLFQDDGEAGVSEVMERYIKDKQPDLIVVDTLSRLSPKTKDGVKLLNKLARDHEIPIVAVDHPLKINSNKKDGIAISEVKGAYSEFAGSADGFLGLSRHGSDKSISGTLNIDHKDLPPRSLALVMDLDVMRWKISKSDPISSLPAEKQAVRAYLEQHPSCSPKEIATVLGVPRSTMRTRLEVMRKEGLIHGSGNSTSRTYSLVPLLLGRTLKPIRERTRQPADRQADRPEPSGS